MGFFDWFRREKRHLELRDDMIWLSRDAKLKGIAKAVEACFAEPEPPVEVLLVAHFEDTLGMLEPLVSSVRPARVALAVDLDRIQAALGPLSDEQRLDAIVAERHPLSRHDEGVLEFCRELPCRCRVGFHMSLDDPLLKVFAGDWVEGVLQQLGMREDEPLESHLVTRRIRAAQRKIERLAATDLRAPSAEEWMELNCRG